MMDWSILILGIPLLLALGLGLASGIVMIFGGMKMLRLESHGWSLAACILALLPFNPTGIIGFVMGIWGLIVLNQPAVRAAFRTRASSPARSRAAGKQTWVLVPVLAIACLALLCLLSPVAIALWRFFAASGDSNSHDGAAPAASVRSNGSTTEAPALPSERPIWEEFGAELRVPISDAMPTHVVYSADGEKLIALIGDDLHTWERKGPPTSLGRKSLSGILPRARYGSLAPGGRLFTLVSDEGLVELWDLVEGKRLAQFKAGTAKCAAFSPDGQLAAVAGDEAVIKLWDVKSGSERKSLEVPKPVTALAFSSEGSLLAGAGSDGSVKLWEAASGEELISLSGYSAKTVCLAFAPDGERLAAGAGDGTVAVWRIPTGKLEATLKNEPGLSSLALAPRGERLAVGNEKGTILTWFRYSPGDDAPLPLGPGRVHAIPLSHVPPAGDDPFLSLAIQDKHAYLVQGNVEKPKRLHVVDISNPREPRFVGRCPVTVLAGNLAVSGNHVYVLDEPNLRVFDVSDPTAPRAVGQCELGGATLWALAIEGRYAYVTDVASVRVIDLADPAAPKQVGRCELETAQGIAVAGGYAYVACDIEGLHVLDVSDPAGPKKVGVFDGPQGAADVAVAGKYAYVAGGEDAVTLWIADISDPRGPKSVGRYGDWIAGNVAVQGDHVFLEGDILDVSNPAAPTREGSYAGTIAVVVDNHLYTADDGGFSIYRVVRSAKTDLESK